MDSSTHLLPSIGGGTPTHINIITKTELERLTASGIPYNIAFVMACVKGDQQELAEHFVRNERQDQEILMRETYKTLIPVEEVILLKQQALLDENKDQSMPLSIQEEYDM